MALSNPDSMAETRERLGLAQFKCRKHAKGTLQY